MLLYAVIDTNVLVSAFLKENSVPRYIIDYMYAGKIIPVYNEEIIAEYSAVLHRSKFCFPTESVDIAVNAIQEIGLKFDGISITEPIPDPKDIVFYAVTLNARKQFETYLITSDLDARQILDSNTFLYALKKGVSNIDKFDVAEFEARYSIRIDQFLDLKSLKGDASDNIPGVAGVGEKTATQLLRQFDTLDGIYEHLDDVKESVRKKLIAGKDSAYMSKRLAALMFDAPVALDLPAMDIARLDTAKLKAMLVKLEFRSLLRKLPDAMKDDTPAAVIDTNDVEEIEPGAAQAGVLFGGGAPSSLYIIYNTYYILLYILLY